MDLLFKEVTLVIQGAREAIQFTDEHLLIKIFLELILVLDYYQWQIVEEILIPLNFLLL
jgi:hypothetical protein